MALWKTLKKLREAKLIGQHLGKRRFIGGDADTSTASDSRGRAGSSRPGSGQPAEASGDTEVSETTNEDSADTTASPPSGECMCACVSWWGCFIFH